MEEAIKNFNLAMEALNVAEKQLNVYVEAEVKRLIPLLKRRKKRADAIDELNELIDKMPKKYKHKRRLYELMERSKPRQQGQWIYMFPPENK